MKISDWVPVPKYLQKDEVGRLLAAARGRVRRASAKKKKIAIRDSFIINLGLSTGLRVMEIAALKCGDLFLEHPVPFLLVRNGKGGKRRIVYFNSRFQRHCRGYLIWKKKTGEPLGPNDPLLRSSVTGSHLTMRAIQKTFKRCAKKAGLSSSYSIHCLRHTYACFLLKASNWNIRLVQKQLGHARVATTQVYADVMMPDTRKAVDRLYQ